MLVDPHSTGGGVATGSHAVAGPKPVNRLVGVRPRYGLRLLAPREDAATHGRRHPADGLADFKDSRRGVNNKSEGRPFVAVSLLFTCLL